MGLPWAAMGHVNRMNRTVRQRPKPTICLNDQDLSFEDKVKVFRVYRRIQDNVALFERALFEGVQDLVHVVVRLKVHQQPHISCGSAAIEPRTKPAGRTIA